MLSQKQLIERRLVELRDAVNKMPDNKAGKMLAKRHNSQIERLTKELERINISQQPAKEFKECRGTGKAKGYGCKAHLPKVKYNKINHVYGLGKSCGCYGNWLLNTEEGKKKSKLAIQKATRQRRDIEQARGARKDRRSHAKELQKTQRLVNKFVRLRDRGKPCISSGIPYLPDFDAGHLFSVKQYAGLRFDLDNIHGQSINANRFKEGDEVNYLINLKHRIGEKRAQALVERAQEYRKNGRRFSIPELKEIQEDIKQRIKKIS